MAREGGNIELERLGTMLKTKAPDQHASIIESRNAILSHAMHVMEEEFKRQCIEVSFKRLLGEATFVTNASTFYNGVSPYNAYTGRQPPFLPDLENVDFPRGGELTDTQREQRIREVIIESITQTTAVAKTIRALGSKTTADGAREYKVGDLIDYHRTPDSNDESGGWNGPCRVSLLHTCC